MPLNYGTPTFHLYLELPNPAVNALWDEALWDVDVWDNSFTLVDIYSYVRSGDVRFGPKRREAFNPASATFTLSNPGGLFSPANSFGPYYGQLKPWRRIFFSMDIQDLNSGTTSIITVPLFTGYITNIQESFNGKVDPVVTFSCADAMTFLARTEQEEQGAQGAGETTAERFNRILDNNNWSLSLRNVGPTVNTVAATTLSQNAADELRDVAEAEGCDIWVDAEGVIQFPGQGNIDQLGTPYIFFSDQDPDSSSVLLFDVGEFDNHTFGHVEPNSTTSATDYGALVYAYKEFEGRNELLDYGNYAVFGRRGENPPGALVDVNSYNAYGRKTYTKTDLICETDFQVLNLAQRWLKVNSEPRWSVDYIVVQLHQSTSYWSLLSLIELGTAVTVERTPDASYTIRQDCFVDGYEIAFNSDTTWFMTLRLRPVISFAEGL